MKASLKWLQDYVDINLPLAELANRLTMAGIEVGGIEVIGGNWKGVVVGQIVAVNPHPNADRLTLPTVDLGTEQQTVVCGAPNLSVGDKVAFAHLGAQLIDGHSGEVVRLKSAKIRGVVSSGMVCSEKELGISGNHESIMVLSDEAPVGTPLADYLGDTIFDLEVTPNRPDCLSMIGLAREIAALTGQDVHLPEVRYEEAAIPIDQRVSVEITAPELCPRYCASLISGVKVGSSPMWMQQRLLACGMRPINNIVDVTNYVMLEYGQPLHAFDYDAIRGRRIIVRRATEGEALVTLDGVNRVLSRDMLVIADEERAVALAGVMGGADSEVTHSTNSILLEAASFNPANNRHTSRTLRLISEASYRYERGISPELTVPALKRATQLFAELAGGEVAGGIIDVYPGKQEPKPILISTGEVKRYLGVEFSLDQIVAALAFLGFDCKTTASASEVSVTAPYWRSDISRGVDLIEEVARSIGYDQIPTTMLSDSIPRHNPEPIISLKQKVGHSLIGFGFQEIITSSLTNLEMLGKLLAESHPLKPKPIRLANPMSIEQEYLRPNLRANLLAALSANRRHEEGGIRLFELGRVYLFNSKQPKDLPDEPEVLCGVLSGPRLGEWGQGGEKVLDFFDAKGVVEGLLAHLGVEASFEEHQDETLHPAKQASIVVADNRLGVVGELHPKVLQAFDIPETACLFEINLTALLPFTTGHKVFQPIWRFPAVARDIALVVDVGISHQMVMNVIKSFSLVREATIFDVYSGGQVPPGKKSLAYRITFQSPSHTLTDKEVNKVQQQLLNKLSKELGAILRG